MQKKKLHFKNLSNDSAYNLDLRSYDLNNLGFVVFLKDIDDEV